MKHQSLQRASGMRLVRVFLMYLSGSYAILEAVDFISDKLGFPDWVFIGALALVLLGLPVAAATSLRWRP